MKTVFNSKRLKVIPSCRSGGGSITFFEMILFFVLVNFLILLEDGQVILNSAAGCCIFNSSAFKVVGKCPF
ncbi:hypothetical protein CVO74_03120 [Xanthomonas prunicola]|nr:hypothetical protein CVO74_03120 [Xanthomonas prunicola]